MKNIYYLGIAILFCFTNCVTKEAVDPQRYKILTTVKELHEFYPNFRFDTSGKSEQTKIRKFFDGSYELKYTYDLLESPDYDPLFYSIKVEVEPTESEAKENFKTSKTVLAATNSAVGLELVDFDSLNLPGDEHYYAIRTSKGKPTGVFLSILAKKRIYTLITSGIYSTDHSLVTDLILPKLGDLANFEYKE